MTITATQYVFKASALTATTTATVGAYIVPSAVTTRAQMVAMTVANTSTTAGVRNWVDVQIWDGTTAWDIAGKRTPIDPGGSFVVIGIEKHMLPTGGGIYVTPYATTGLTAAISVVELT